MPSFLSKVFGRKKDDKESPRSPGRASEPPLLEGKFESVSPSATKFPEVANGKGTGGQGKEKEKEKDTGFTLFKAKSRPASPETNQKRADAPHLSLNLSGSKEDLTSRALGVVFEVDSDAQITLSDSVIGDRRLNPSETLILIRACSQAITARGLETLGIMHPHWHSASPDTQRRLISLFIQSLAPKSPTLTLSPTSPAFATAFESEISSTRSPHDVAAVLRWGLRHLELEGSSFGREDGWYKNFFEAERTSLYPNNAFSTLLGPQLPQSHLDLLTATLEVFSSLAAHAEANGISGSKLSKFFGLWLLVSDRVRENDDWPTFYARWEQTGRVLEHLFLSRIREETISSRLPTRLLELVNHYPYNKTSSPSSDADLLPRPRFSTRRYDALFVRIEAELLASASAPKLHPLRLVSEAFEAETAVIGAPHTEIWETLKKAGSSETAPSPGGYPGLSRVFADETIRFLSLIPLENSDNESSPAFSLFVRPAGASHRRSFSLNDRDEAAVTVNTAKPAPVASSSNIGTDWTEFSTSGFFEDAPAVAPLATTLIDKEKDMEVTRPKQNIRSKVNPLSHINGRKSLDTPRTLAPVEKHQPQETPLVSKATSISLTQLDEAFIDFWSDALLDPISANWPTFVICKLKTSLPGVEVDGKRLEWLVIEQAFKRPAPPPATPISPATATTATSESGQRPRPSSPKSSFKSDITFSSTRKRFSFFTASRASTSSDKASKSGKKKAGQSPAIGEMGEILAEEDEREREKAETIKVRVPSPKPKKSMDVPRKSVDTSKKGIDAANKANGGGVVPVAATAATGVALEAAKPETESQTPATNGHAKEATATADDSPIAPVAPVPEPSVTAQTNVLVSNGSATVDEAAPLVAETDVKSEPAPAPTNAELLNVPEPAGPASLSTAASDIPVLSDTAPTPPAAVKETAPSVPVPAEAAAPISAEPAVEEDVKPATEKTLEPTPAEPEAPEPIATDTAREPSPAAPLERDAPEPDSALAATEEAPPALEPEVAGPEATEQEVPGPAAPLGPEVTEPVMAPVALEPTPVGPEVIDSVVEPEAKGPEALMLETSLIAAVEPDVSDPASVGAEEALAAPVEEAAESQPAARLETEVVDVAPVEETTEPVVEPAVSVEESTEPSNVAPLEPEVVDVAAAEEITEPAAVEPEVSEPIVPEAEESTSEAAVATTEEPHVIDESDVSQVTETAAVIPQDDASGIVQGEPEASVEDLSADVPSVLEPAPEVDQDDDEPHMHSEPLYAPEHDVGDHDVALAAVPIVEVNSAHEEPGPVADEIVEDSAPAPTDEEDAPQQPESHHGLEPPRLSPKVESIVLAGETPGPQAMLDSVLEPEPLVEDAPVDTLLAADSSQDNVESLEHEASSQSEAVAPTDITEDPIPIPITETETSLKISPPELDTHATNGDTTSPAL